VLIDNENLMEQARQMINILDEKCVFSFWNDVYFILFLAKDKDTNSEPVILLLDTSRQCHKIIARCVRMCSETILAPIVALIEPLPKMTVLQYSFLQFHFLYICRYGVHKLLVNHCQQIYQVLV
jgi:hypothetical protein